MNKFQGDPKLYLTPDGADLNYFEGQPVMDSGLENLALLSLFGGSGWWANDLMETEEEKYMDDFEENSKGSITIKKLAAIEQDAKRILLKSKAFGDAEVSALNPVSYRLDISILIKSPGKDFQELLLIRNGQNWQNQAIDPASGRSV